ncbi:MAG: HDIG domain-containing protein [Deltaproteobacteria bacterium]|nr:HDIG domain-containing protein [Deltaproteobacteria bacterium]
METGWIEIPSEERCRQLIAEMGMMEHIVAHSLQVRRLALFLTDRLGIPGLNRELIRAAAHLHDITKTRSFATHENHDETGAELLTGLGYPEVGRVIAQHVRLESYFPSAIPTEAEIVNYADKRVLHDRIAPLRGRMTYILEKYGRSLERKQEILLTWQKTEMLERRIFDRLPFAPEDVERLLSAADSA